MEMEKARCYWATPLCDDVDRIPDYESVLSD